VRSLVKWCDIRATLHQLIVLVGLLWEFTLLLDKFHSKIELFYFRVCVCRWRELHDLTLLSNQFLWMFMDRIVFLLYLEMMSFSFGSLFHLFFHACTLGFFPCEVSHLPYECRFLVLSLDNNVSFLLSFKNRGIWVVFEEVRGF